MKKMKFVLVVSDKDLRKEGVQVRTKIERNVLEKFLMNAGKQPAPTPADSALAANLFNTSVEVIATGECILMQPFIGELIGVHQNGAKFLHLFKYSESSENKLDEESGKHVCSFLCPKAYPKKWQKLADEPWSTAEVNDYLLHAVGVREELTLSLSQNKLKIEKFSFKKNGDATVLVYDGIPFGEATSRNIPFEECTMTGEIKMERTNISIGFIQKKKVEELSKEVSEETKKLGRAAGMEEELVDKISKILSERYFLTPKQILQVAKMWQKYPENLKVYIPDVDDINYVDVNGEFKRFLGYICTSKDGNIPHGRLVGIQSSGKNTLISQACALLQKPELDISMSRDTSREDIEGSETISHVKFSLGSEDKIYEQLVEGYNDEKNLFALTPGDRVHARAEAKKLARETVMQKIEFVDEALVTAMENGCCVVFDEVNMPYASVLSRYHAALDNRRYLNVAKRGRSARAMNGFFMIGTMNPCTYAGTQTMNTATESRFSFTMKIQPPQDIRQILEVNCPDADPVDIEDVNNIYTKVYDAVQADTLADAFLSIRNYIATLNNKGWGDLRTSCMDHLCQISQNDPDMCQAMEQIVNMIVS